MIFFEKTLIPPLVIVLVAAHLSEAGFVQNLGKCRVKDYDCTRDKLQTVFRDIGKTGIPELGIPAIDPFPVNNVTVSVLNLVDISMVDGIARGIKDCVVDKLETDVENERATMEMTCDITVKGHYKVSGDSPLIKNFLGGSTIHGEGFGKVTLEKFHMKFDYHILVREIDGDLFIQCQYEDLKYSYSLGKATFAADNLYLGKTEASGLVLSLLNDNWKFIMQSFGKPFLDKAMDIAYEQSHKFFDVVPTKYYLTDDLSAYVKKD